MLEKGHKKSPIRFSLIRDLIECSLERDWSVAHTRGCCDGREEGCESGYYDLHRYLYDAFLHPLPPFLALGGELLGDPVIERGGNDEQIKTYIDNVVMDEEDDTKVKGIFNLNGQRLSAPQKGLNIIDGKKVFIK